jgi:signal transduction histidine kinase
VEGAPLGATLTEASQSRRRFLAILSRELRTALISVLLGIDEMQEDERFCEARPTFTMMRRNIKLQAQIIEQLMDVTKRE